MKRLENCKQHLAIQGDYAPTALVSMRRLVLRQSEVVEEQIATYHKSYWSALFYFPIFSTRVILVAFLKQRRVKSFSQKLTCRLRLELIQSRSR